ncbi:phasin [Skermanella stibiiresistens SB22]|uniref:Phasin n=1 Tax=Skermanella stibiiresistens SB22 TaxID=1385369 RepID=W9H6N4_9PROT|nr:phasin family protein [Skermanella stibiiresistens]EWY40451.1 phasin [Skermanella stibiiresistens SB22]
MNAFPQFKVPSFDQFKVPGFDFSAVFDIQRRNVEAFTAASQTFAQGMQTVVQRQGEIARQSIEQFQGLMTNAKPTTAVEETLVKQTDLVKAAYEKNIANARELQDIVSKVTTEASDILSRRVVASLDEIKAVAQPKKVAERTVKAA